MVSIIIVNWNGRKHLEKCLSSLFAQDYKKIEVILVDNASGDDSVAWVKSNFSQVKIVVNSKNLGFAQANNLGYQKARGEHILFLNNDTQVTSEFLSRLIEILESDPQVGGVQSRLLLMDEPRKLDSVGAFLTPTGFLYHFGVNKKDISKYHQKFLIHTAKGACMLFKRQVLEKTKVAGEIFDSRYFAYFEESDLCHRVWLAGYKIVFVPDSVVYHKMGATSGTFDNAFIQFHSYKNRINSYLKNLSVASLVKILTSHLILCEILAIYYAFRAPGVAWAIQKAFFWNIINLPMTLQKRKAVQTKIRKIPDRVFFDLVLVYPSLNYYLNLFGGLKHYQDVIMPKIWSGK